MDTKTACIVVTILYLRVALGSEVCTAQECETDGMELLQSSLGVSSFVAHDDAEAKQVVASDELDGGVGWWRKVKRSKKTGKVESLYTFAAVPIGVVASVKNKLSPDGCFPGKRVYGQTLEGGLDYASGLLPAWTAHNPMQEVVVLDVDIHKQHKGQNPPNFTDGQVAQIKYYGHETYKKCSRVNSRAPVGKLEFGTKLGGTAVGDNLHQKSYFFNYTDPELMKMFLISQANTNWYSLCPLYKIRRISKISIKDPFMNWFNFSTWKGDPDYATLLQEVSTKKCYLTFTGVNGEHLLDMLQHVIPKPWCGMVLSKFVVDELLGYVNSGQWKAKIHDKLPKCNGLVLPGHSLGGSITGVLAACLNQKSWSKQVYDSLLWKFSTPELLTPDPGMNNNC